jgi:hypothetical protein
MIFVRLAMGSGVDAAFRNRTVPSSRSARIAERAATVGTATASRGVTSTDGNGDGRPSGGTGVGGGAPRPVCAPAKPTRAALPATAATTTATAIARRVATGLTPA